LPLCYRKPKLWAETCVAAEVLTNQEGTKDG
jgi:hypothetical protein